MNESHEPLQAQNHESLDKETITPPEEDPQAHRDALESQQNFLRGTLGGLAGALVGGSVWGILKIATNQQMSYMAVGVAFLVSYCIRTMGKGVKSTFGDFGGILAVFGCVLGDLIYIVHSIAKEYETTYMQVLKQFNAIIELVRGNVDFLTALFYLIALYVGYYFSFVHLEDGE